MKRMIRRSCFFYTLCILASAAMGCGLGEIPGGDCGNGYSLGHGKCQCVAPIDDRYPDSVDSVSRQDASNLDLSFCRNVDKSYYQDPSKNQIIVCRNFECGIADCPQGYVHNEFMSQCISLQCDKPGQRINEQQSDCECISEKFLTWDNSRENCICIRGYEENPDTHECEPKKCTNPGEIYSLEKDACICDENNFWTGAPGSCKCNEGYELFNSRCVTINCVPVREKETAETCVCNDVNRFVGERGDCHCDTHYKQKNTDGPCEWFDCDRDTEHFDSVINDCVCEPHYERVNGQGPCVPFTCKVGETFDEENNTCICDDEKNWEGDRGECQCKLHYEQIDDSDECTAFECDAVREDFDEENNTCICRDSDNWTGERDGCKCKQHFHQVEIDGPCVPFTCDDATEDFDETTNTCICKPYFERINGICTPFACLQGETFVSAENTCVCDGDKNWEGERTACVCKPYYELIHEDDEACTHFDCKQGEKFDSINNTCKCDGDKNWTGSRNACECKPHFELVHSTDASCTAFTCKTGEKFVDESNTCVCDDGKNWTGSRNACKCKQHYEVVGSSDTCTEFTCNKQGETFDSTNNTCKCDGDKNWTGSRNNCKCKQHYELVNSTDKACTEFTCHPTKEKFDSSKNTCVCNTSGNWTGSRNNCKCNGTQYTSGGNPYCCKGTVINGSSCCTSYAFNNTCITKVGDFVNFGKYYQSSESTKSAIKWRVIKIDTTNKRLLLLSEYVLDARNFHNTRTSTITWAESNLRTWLNGTFYNAAFSDTEKSKIYKSTIKTPNNPSNGTSGGADTQDYLFLLSAQEIRDTTLFPSNDALKGFATTHAIKSGLTIDDDYDVNTCGNVACLAEHYWTRTPGTKNNYVIYMMGDGRIAHNEGYYADNMPGNGVKPAMWVKYE